jgi:hypothetical protein
VAPMCCAIDRQSPTHTHQTGFFNANIAVARAVCADVTEGQARILAFAYTAACFNLSRSLSRCLPRSLRITSRPPVRSFLTFPLQWHWWRVHHHRLLGCAHAGRQPVPLPLSCRR